MSTHRFEARDRLTVGDRAHEVFRLDRIHGATRFCPTA